MLFKVLEQSENSLYCLPEHESKFKIRDRCNHSDHLSKWSWGSIWNYLFPYAEKRQNNYSSRLKQRARFWEEDEAYFFSTCRSRCFTWKIKMKFLQNLILSDIWQCRTWIGSRSETKELIKWHWGLFVENSIQRIESFTRHRVLIAKENSDVT